MITKKIKSAILRAYLYFVDLKTLLRLNLNPDEVFWVFETKLLFLGVPVLCQISSDFPKFFSSQSGALRWEYNILFRRPEFLLT